MKSLFTLNNFFEKQLRMLMFNLQDLEVQKCNLFNKWRMLQEQMQQIKGSDNGLTCSSRVELQIVSQRLKGYQNKIHELDLEIQLCRNKMIRCYIQLNKIVVLQDENIFHSDAQNDKKDFCYFLNT